MNLQLNKNTENENIRQWTSPTKLSFKEICEKSGISLEYDQRNIFFWNMSLSDEVVINNDLLHWCGYKGSFKRKKYAFLKLLKKQSPPLQYDKIEDTNYRKTKNIIMKTFDFQSLLMQMRSQKAAEIRMLYVHINHILMQYLKYEKYFEKHRHELIQAHNNQLNYIPQ